MRSEETASREELVSPVMTRRTRRRRSTRTPSLSPVETEHLDALVGKINGAHDRVETAFLSCVKYAQEAGRLLLEVKDKLEHGKFEDWVEANCKFSARTARVYLRLANELPKLDEVNRQRAADLSLRGVLRLLANPKVKVEAASTCTADEPEVSVIRLADVELADLLAELEARGREAAEDGVLRLARKWAEAIGMEVIIKPKTSATTTGDSGPGGVAEDDAPDTTDAPDPDDDPLGIPPFRDRRGEAMKDDHA